jgi:hypothetical protein
MRPHVTEAKTEVESKDRNLPWKLYANNEAKINVMLA